MDIDELVDVGNEANIFCLPTFVVYQKSEKKDELMGASTLELEAFLRKYAWNKRNKTLSFLFDLIRVACLLALNLKNNAYYNTYLFLLYKNNDSVGIW